jgi:anti-anti-sigma factor
MTYFRSVFDSPEQVRSSLAGTCRWNNTVDAYPRFCIDIDEPTGGPLVIHVVGDLDVVTAPLLTACLDESVSTGHNVALDLLNVPFLGCAGAAALHSAATRLSTQRCRLTVSVPRTVQAILGRIGISAAVPCFDTVAAAFRAAQAPHIPAAANQAPPFPVLGRAHPRNCSLMVPTGAVSTGADPAQPRRRCQDKGGRFDRTRTAR